MKTRVFIFLLLMTMAFTAIYASEDPTENEEHVKKKQELDLLADRFKAETGFTGEIQYSYEHMNLGVFEGKFSGITITSAADTTAFRAVFNQMLDKVLPYSNATRNQLKTSHINSGRGSTYTDYFQVVNGYRVEGAGWIRVKYDSGRYRFVISNNAVEIPQINANELITKDRAEEIALLDKNDARYRKARVKSTFYTNMGSETYYLAYLVCVSDDSNPIFGDFTYYIDALNGKIVTKHRENFIYSNVSVRVMGNEYVESSAWDVPPTYYTEEPLEDVRVIVYPDSSQTDQSGYTYFYDVVDSTKTAKLTNSLFTLSCSSDTLNAISYTTASVDTLHHYTVSIPDNTYYASNAYIEAVNHVNGLIRLNETQDYFQNHLNIITFSTPPDPAAQTYGGYSPRYNFIWLRDGRLSDTVRHELSHHFIHRKIGVWSFDAPDTIHTNTGAMDEAFANYLCGAPTNNSILPGIGNYCDMSLLNSLPASTSLNEDQYAKYANSLCISSAWWGLRNNQYFGQVEPGKNAVDTLLVSGLDVVYDQLPQNSSYRYKPRYFYNILMKRVDTDSEPWPLNAKQIAINDAYNSRGLKFYPTVESYSGGNKGRNVYNMNDSVYVEISNCPQNTRINIYVINHNDYVYTDGAPVSALNDHLANGFTQAINATTNADGEWSSPTPIWIATEEGEYDIIVDIGSPTAPDGIIHFAFSGANVMDGFDGRSEAGFTVIDNGTDVVVAEHAFPESQISRSYK